LTTEGEAVNTKRALRAAARKFGYYVGDYTNSVQSRRQQLLTWYQVDHVHDIGANTGQYAIELRRHGFVGSIWSFEPVGLAYHALSNVSSRDPTWSCWKVAVGAEPGETVIQVSKDTQYSSVLAITERSLEASSETRAIYTEPAVVKTLDVLASGAPEVPTIVKIDVQGFEEQVLAGALETLKKSVMVEMELSMVALYEGQILIQDQLAICDNLGFTLALTEPVMRHPSGSALQINGIFVRE
jgi:FkbM family methyltransferase